MAAKLGGDEEDAIVDINITPFVDIILVVLIIFMVTTSYIVKKSIKVNLPEAATGESTQDVSLGLMLACPDSSQSRCDEPDLLLDGEPITEQELRNEIAVQQRAIQGTQNELICLIGADLRVSHGSVVHLIDLVKQAGVARFAIGIDPISQPAEEPSATP